MEPRPKAENSTAALLPDLPNDLVFSKTNPSLGSVADVAGLFADVADEADTYAETARFIARLTRFNELLECSYERDRLAVRIYSDAEHWWSAGLFVVVKGEEDLGGALGAVGEIGFCWLLRQAPVLSDLMLSAPRPVPKLQGCLEERELEQDGERYYLAWVGTTDWMCAELAGEDSPRPDVADLKHRGAVSPPVYEWLPDAGDRDLDLYVAPD